MRVNLGYWKAAWTLKVQACEKEERKMGKKPGPSSAVSPGALCTVDSSLLGACQMSGKRS